jgi:hypothetical protein
MSNEKKKTASKRSSSAGPGKPNPGRAKSKKVDRKGKGTKSQSNKEKVGGISSTGAKKLSGNSAKRKLPLKEK